MLRVEGLNKAFVTGEGKVDAVRDVSFEVKTGEFFALLGSSGCGKTPIIMASQRVVSYTRSLH